MGEAKRRGSYEDRVELAQLKRRKVNEEALQLRETRFQQQCLAEEMLTEEQAIASAKRAQKQLIDSLQIQTLFASLMAVGRYAR